MKTNSDDNDTPKTVMIQFSKAQPIIINGNMFPLIFIIQSKMELKLKALVPILMTLTVCISLNLKTQPIHVLIVGRILDKDDVFKSIKEITTAFVRNGYVDFYFTDAKIQQKMRQLQPKYTTQVFLPVKHQKIIDYIITVGGDGTILYIIHYFLGYIPPLITFQRGTVGFMCRFPLESINQVVQQVSLHHYGKIEMPFGVAKLMRLQATKSQINGNSSSQQTVNVCLNQVRISRNGWERVTIQIWVNDEYLTSTTGEGLIISTSTGSTGQALNQGGPVIHNKVEALQIILLSPNSIAARPMVLPSDSEIKIRMHKSSRAGANVIYDHQSQEQFGLNQEITIKRAKYDIQFYEPKREDKSSITWIQRVNSFLGWNNQYKSSEYDQKTNKHDCVGECLEDN